MVCIINAAEATHTENLSKGHKEAKPTMELQQKRALLSILSSEKVTLNVNKLMGTQTSLL